MKKKNIQYLKEKTNLTQNILDYKIVQLRAG